MACSDLMFRTSNCAGGLFTVNSLSSSCADVSFYCNIQIALKLCDHGLSGGKRITLNEAFDISSCIQYLEGAD